MRNISVVAFAPFALTMILLHSSAEGAAPDVPTSQRCSSEMDYTVPQLQAAREYIKSSRFNDHATKMHCGLQILASLPPTEKIENCKACSREYVGLMADVALFASRAAAMRAPPETADARRQKEIEVRMRLNDYLLNAGDRSLIDIYWNTNFLSLADALEIAGDGKSYHTQASSVSADMMSDRAFRIWIKAIRSCEKWDFASSEKRAISDIRKSICEEPCRKAADRLRERFDLASFERKEQLEDYLEDELPTTAHCPTQR